MKPDEFYRKKIEAEAIKKLAVMEKENTDFIVEIFKEAFPSCDVPQINIGDTDVISLTIEYSKSRFIKENRIVDHSFYINGNSTSLITITDSFTYYPEAKGEAVNGVITFHSEYIEQQTKNVLNTKLSEVIEKKKKKKKSLETIISNISEMSECCIPNLFGKLKIS